MGGTLTVVIREEDGTTHAQHRWTNNLSYFVQDLKLMNKDKDYVRFYINSCEKEDRDVGISPCEYGIVVIDLLKNHILSLQGYTDLGVIFSTSIKLELSGKANIIQNPDGTYSYSIRRDLDWDSGHRAAKLLDFFRNQRVKLYQPLDASEENCETSNLSEEEFKLLIDKFEYGNFILDLSPFTYIAYNENKLGLNSLREKLKELGFNLTEEEEIEWDSFYE